MKNKAICNYKLGNYEEAIHDYTQIIKIDPLDPQALFNRGVAKLKLDLFETAFTDFTGVIKLDKNFAEAYYNRANASLQLNDSDKACDDMKEAARLGYEPAFEHIRSLCGS